MLQVSHLSSNVSTSVHHTRPNSRAVGELACLLKYLHSQLSRWPQDKGRRVLLTPATVATLQGNREVYMVERRGQGR